ncbi:hypothetical protein [Streptomyces sp. NPDC055692]|uniref:hypothetical protein n=1 Tax=Streptomyces sp. NPDC055692 TaxID=3155683 RepID=UPI0034479C1A
MITTAAPAGAVFRRLETRPLQDLTPYSGNARRGDVGTCPESLTMTGIHEDDTGSALLRPSPLQPEAGQRLEPVGGELGTGIFVTERRSSQCQWWVLRSWALPH